MLEHFTFWQRITLYISLGFWASASLGSAFFGFADLFSALGSFALCISFIVFLTDRYMAQEERRRWDSQILTQSRMMWRYYGRVEGNKSKDPTPLNKLRDQISSNFDDLLAAKARERAMETFRYELLFSVVATLQWGFGHMLISLIKGT